MEKIFKNVSSLPFFSYYLKKERLSVLVYTNTQLHTTTTTKHTNIYFVLYLIFIFIHFFPQILTRFRVGTEANKVLRLFTNYANFFSFAHPNEHLFLVSLATFYFDSLDEKFYIFTVKYTK